MFISIRKYDNVPDPGALLRAVEDKLIPAVKAMPGFQSYTTVNLGGGSVISISLFTSQADAEAGNASAKTLVQQHIAALVSGPPTVMVGEVYATHSA